MLAHVFFGALDVPGSDRGHGRFKSGRVGMPLTAEKRSDQGFAHAAAGEAARHCSLAEVDVLADQIDEPDDTLAGPGTVEGHVKLEGMNYPPAQQGFNGAFQASPIDLDQKLFAV